jgi:hypothetical protein
MIITSQHTMSQRLLNKLAFNSCSLNSVPTFKDEEVTKFALELGCPNKTAQKWAKFTILQTKGHPQLVL